MTTTSTTDSPQIFHNDDDSELVKKAARTLPDLAVQDLLSIGVCIRCIFRLFGIGQSIYSCTMPSPSILFPSLGQETKVVDGFKPTLQESNVAENICRICLGVLQFVYCDTQQSVVKKDSAYDLGRVIVEHINQEGYKFDNFSLEVSLPTVIMENEQALCSYMQNKYKGELWHQEKFTSGCILIKDALILSLTNPLETLLGAKSGLSSFHIRLTYTIVDASMKIQSSIEKNECNKRRKTDNESISIDLSLDHCENRSGFSSSNEDDLTNDLQISDCLNFLPKKAEKPCHLTFLCNTTPIYVGGRYLKYSRNVSQSRWIIDDERKGDASVEEIIGDNILPMCRGDSYKFHAAGREDIDVRMLGSGRPFLVEIQNARHVPSEVSVIKEIEMKINSMEGNLVKVKNLKVLGSQGWALMREGETEKQKQYTALVWISRPLSDDDLKTISSLKDMQILQRTPIRVLHRRSPLDREKIIHWMNIEKIAERPQYFLLHLCTQAGTYIKEFVHGDLGRTHPNIGSILGCRAEILQLDVTEVKMDCFLDDE